MKRITFLTTLTTLLALVAFIPSVAEAAVPQLINFQGILRDGSGNPVANSTYSVTFTIYNAPAGGINLWSETQSVTTTSGLFTILLGASNPVPDSAFNDPSRYLGIAVSPDPEMTPRQRLVSVPYDLNGWSTTGNGNTNPGRNFLGTADNQALELKVNGSRALRIEPNATSPNLIGGQSANNVTAGVKGATISGGGESVFNNRVTDDYGTVGGGEDNRAGDNAGTTSDRTRATVGGGTGNTASGTLATVGGGQSNTASGGRATVPGGESNTASGNYSFAAGRRAKANHLGSFVWADSSANADFASTAANQFLIRAANVGIGTNSPTKKLEVAGSIKVGTNDSVFSSNLCSNSPLSLQAPAGTTRMYIDDVTGKVGIGTISPSEQLQVAGDIRAGGLLPMGISTESNALINLDANFRLNTDDVVRGGAFRIDTRGGSNQLFNWYSRAAGSGVEDLRMVLTEAGNLGIGTVTPGSRLHVREDINGIAALIIDNQDAGTFSGQSLDFSSEDGAASARIIVFDNSNPSNPALMRFANNLVLGDIDFMTGSIVRMQIDQSGNVGIGTSLPSFRLDVEQSSATVAAFNRTTTDGTLLQFQKDAANVGSISVAAGVVSYNAFTGSHYAWTDEVLERGELVTLTGINRNSHDNPESEVIYGIKRSTVANDPACLGSYLALQEPAQPAGTENPHLIMAVGNGDMWVVDEAGDIQPGDYLISSDVSGHAMKDDEAKYSIGHIVARAAESVNWSAVTQSVNGRKHARISVLFGNFVRGNAANLNQTIALQGKTIDRQQKELDDLKARLLKLEENSPRAQVEK